MTISAFPRQPLRRAQRPQQWLPTRSDAQPIWMWIQLSCVAGIVGSLAYLLAITGLLSLTASYALKAAFGPLIAVAYLGFFTFLQLHRQTTMLYLATMIGVLAGVMANMILLASAFQSLLISTEVTHVMSAAWYASNTLQLGLDISRDLYLALAMGLLGGVLWGHPRFHKIFALATGGLGVLGLILNLWMFPLPAYEVGVVDLRALVGIWYLLICLHVLTSRRWLEGRRQATFPSPPVALSS